MKTLYDFGIEVQKIREAINGLTVKGSENASLIVYAVNKCNDIISDINKVIDQYQPDQESSGRQNGGETEPVEKQEGDVNGEPDSGISS